MDEVVEFLTEDKKNWTEKSRLFLANIYGYTVLTSLSKASSQLFIKVFLLLFAFFQSVFEQAQIIYDEKLKDWSGIKI